MATSRSAVLTLFVIVVLLGPRAVSQTYLSADGQTDTYALITSELAPGHNPIEVPDASHPAGSPHIRQVLDPDLGHYVFQFHMHLVQVTPTPIDDDPSTGDTDRQRNEIKTYASSPEYLKAYAGDTVSYRWKFKLDAGFQPSPKFTHIHQIKPVDGNDSTPVITYLPVVSGGSNVMQLRYYDDANNLTSLKQVPLAPFLGTWVEASETITFGTHGSYSMTLKKVSDGSVLMSYTNSDINLLRTGASFYRPKWGIYRSVEQYQYLRDEVVRFDNFCLAKAPDDCSAAADFSVTTTPATQSVAAGGSLSYTATIAPNHGFNGNVALMVTGLPNGATASFDQSTVMGPGNSNVTLHTTNATAPGTYTAILTATSGAITHIANIQFEVTPAPDFALSVTPPSQTVTGGQNATYTATVTPSNGFNSTVTFGVSGAPSHTTASFDHDTVTGSGSVHLTVVPTLSASAGAYTLTITGTGGGSTHTSDVGLTINGLPGFLLTMSPPSQSIHAGTSATYTATITPENGFSGNVSFSCEGLPPHSQCTFTPSTVATAGSAVTTTLAITTTAPTLAKSRLSRWPAFAIVFPMICLFPGRRRPTSRSACLLPLFMAALSLLASCGGGGGTTTAPRTPVGGTPAGSYSVMVKATSGTLQSSTGVSITVMP